MCSHYSCLAAEFVTGTRRCSRLLHMEIVAQRFSCRLHSMQIQIHIQMYLNIYPVVVQGSVSVSVSVCIADCGRKLIFFSAWGKLQYICHLLAYSRYIRVQTAIDRYVNFIYIYIIYYIVHIYKLAHTHTHWLLDEDISVTALRRSFWVLISSCVSL